MALSRKHYAAVARIMDGARAHVAPEHRPAIEMVARQLAAYFAADNPPDNVGPDSSGRLILRGFQRDIFLKASGVSE